MKYYEIEYIYNGEKHTAIERPVKGWEEQFYKKVLYRIESLVNAGATIIKLTEYN